MSFRKHVQQSSGKIQNTAFGMFALFLCYMFMPQNLSAADTDTLRFSIRQALEYASSNNPDIKNAYADVALADQTVKEVTAMGIPQVRGQVQFQDQIAKQVFVFPLNGVATPVRVGNKYTTQAALNVNWLLLDGTYFLGLKSAKEYTRLSKKIAVQTENDVKIDIAKTYFLALIAKENISLMNASYETLQKTYNEVTALYKEGFAEELESDRLKLQLSNLDVSRKKMRDQYEVALGLLKVKMGLEQSKPVILTDNIDQLNTLLATPDTEESINWKGRSDFQVLQQQAILNKYNIKRYQYGKYPNLAGAFTYQQSNFGETIDFSRWYDNSFLALQMNIPIFSGFSNDAKIQKAKIELLKTETNIKKAENMIGLEVQQNRLRFLRAQEYVQQQKENLELAGRILKTSTIKYREGVGSNLELVTANQDLKTTQTNYLTAVYELLVAKLDYMMSLGKEIKI